MASWNQVLSDSLECEKKVDPVSQAVPSMELGIPGGSQQQASRRNVTPLVKKQYLCKEALWGALWGDEERPSCLFFEMDKLFVLFSRNEGYCFVMGSWGGEVSAKNSVWGLNRGPALAV